MKQLIHAYCVWLYNLCWLIVVEFDSWFYGVFVQIALVMGNGVLNEVLEASVTDPKPTPESTLWVKPFNLDFVH